MMVKLPKLHALFEEMSSVLVAFSGGIDSTVVFKIAHDTLGQKATAVTAVSPTYPEVELEGARRLADEIGGQHLIIQTDQLEVPAFVRNDASRCYHCKTELYTQLAPIAARLGHLRPRRTPSRPPQVRSLSIPTPLVRHRGRDFDEDSTMLQPTIYIPSRVTKLLAILWGPSPSSPPPGSLATTSCWLPHPAKRKRSESSTCAASCRRALGCSGSRTTCSR